MSNQSTINPRAERPDYVLGVGEDELRRLGLQHRLWSGESLRIWRDAGFAPGHTVLDLGAGPGFGAFDMAPLLGPSGRVLAIDESRGFIEYLTHEAARRGLTNISAQVADAQSLELPEGSIDGAWARWVLCFLADPASAVSGVARALRPGGAFAIQDYFNYRAITLAPRSDLFEPVLRAIRAGWLDYGGDDDIGGRLPGMLREAGLEVTEVRTITRAVRPGEALWRWPETYFQNFLPKLVQEGFLSESDRVAFMDEWARRSADPDSFFSTPPMVAIIARKPC